jgi:hypothetical protein
MADEPTPQQQSPASEPAPVPASPAPEPSGFITTDLVRGSKDPMEIGGGREPEIKESRGDPAG